jgi:hypothetical protein
MAKRKVKVYLCAECEGSKNNSTSCFPCNRFELNVFTTIRPSHWEPIESEGKK